MKPSLPSLKKIALSVVGLTIMVLLLLWQGLPRILQSQAEKFVAEKTGHRLVMDRPEFNPFELALRLGKLHLSDPAGQPLFAFDGLLVDLSATSIAKRALVFDAIRLDGPSVTVVELPAGSLNWTPFLAAFEGGENKSEEKKGLPRLDIRSFIITNGKIDYADRRHSAEGFAARIEPLDLELSDLSTLPDEEGRYRISTRTTLGARLELAGRVDLDPIRVAGTVSLADLQLAKLAPYLKSALADSPFAPPDGVLAVSAGYRAGLADNLFDVTIEQVRAQLTGLRAASKEANGPVVTVEAVELKDGRFQLATRELALAGIAVSGGKLALPGIEHPPQFGALTVEDIQVRLPEHHATVGKVRLADGRVRALRQANGSIDLLEALKTLSGAKPTAEKTTTPQQETPPPWRYQVGQIEIADLGVVLREASVEPPLELALDHVAARAEGVSNDPSLPLPVKLSFDVRSGGRFEGAGKVVPASASADIGFKLTDLSLKLAQPFLAQRTTLMLVDGKLTARGRAIYDAKKGPNVKGEFAVRNLRLMEPGAHKPILAWRSLGSRKLRLTQKELDLGELRLVGLDTQVQIDKDKNFNFMKAMKPDGRQKAAEPVPATEMRPADAVPPAPTFIVSIDRLRFDEGEMDFADESLILPFATRIHQLKGSIAGLANRPGAIGQVELDGTVDEYGMARAVGQVELGDPTNGLDLRVQFRNVEMTKLTPYTAHFAGRKIDSGKLSLDLQYKIVKRQLQGENQVIMDKLTLGERVESPTATNLPLDLAIAILQDADGRIDLGLPVSGSLDDPQFSYGAIIWKAITNVLTKIVTAPFRALGALFGGGGEELENIVFETGAPQLAPPEREKVAKLAQAMGKRPGLVLSVGGLWIDADRQVLQDIQLRRTLLMMAGQQVPEQGDPGPVSTQQPKIRTALETLYEKRIGTADLAALKEAFRKANPGQLEESLTGKMMSRLSGLFREKKTLSENEVASLKGTDFYSVLFERLRSKENIPDERLIELAAKRGAGVAEILGSAGVAPERVQLLAPEKGKTEGETAAHEIPLHLTLEPGKTK